MNSTIGQKITNIEANALVEKDICGFSKDNIILTDSGYKSLEDLKVNNYVMTRDNTFSKVISKERTNRTNTIIVHAMGIDYVICTPNQQFLVRENIKRDSSKTYFDGIRPSGRRIFDEPKYVNAKDLNRNHYLGIQIMSSNDNKLFETDNTDFWWLCGTYVGDGCMDMKQYKVLITCNDKDIERLVPALDRLNYEYKIHNKQYERQCFNVTIKNDYFAEFVDDTFGHYSYAKNIPYNVINLPKEQLKAFYMGFLESDGCTLSTNNNISQFTTVNRCLNSATSIIINKLFKRPTRLYFQIRPKTYVIEGRIVNQRDTYQLRFLKEPQKFEHAFVEDNYIWFPFSKLESGPVEELYTIKLESNYDGFVMGNCIVKNF